MKSTIALARPANATPYTALDVVCGQLQIDGLARTYRGNIEANQEIIIVSSRLRWDIAAVPAGMVNFKLHLYSIAPAVIADNAAFDVVAGDRAGYLGSLDLGTPVDLGSTLAIEANNIQKQLVLPATGTLYAYLVTVGGYTPAGNSETGQIDLLAIPAW